MAGPEDCQPSAEDVMKRLEKLDREAAGWKVDLEASLKSLNFIHNTNPAAKIEIYKRSCYTEARTQLDSRLKAFEDELREHGIIRRLEQIDKEAASWKALWLAITNINYLTSLKNNEAEICWASWRRVAARRQALEERFLQMQPEDE